MLDDAPQRSDAPSDELETGEDSTSRQSLESVLASGRETLRLSFDLVSGSEVDFDALDEAVSVVGSELGTLDESANRSNVSLEIAASLPQADAGFLDTVTAWLESTEAETPPPSLAHAESLAREERFSILLHALEVATPEQRPSWISTIERTVRDLDNDLTSLVLLAATREAAENLDDEHFDAWLDPLVPILRRNGARPLGALARIALEGSARAREALWPFVVDELLSTLKGRREGIDDRVHDLDPEALERAIARLCTRPSIARARTAAGMFTVSQRFMHPLLLRLMNSPARDVIGALILGAFRATPPKDPGAAFCVFAIHRYSESLGWLLARQLENPSEPVGADAQRSAAWMLVSALETLPEERRAESWVPAALEWIGERDDSSDPPAHANATSALLRRITSERNGMKKVWSKDCRLAAKAALKQGGRR